MEYNSIENNYLESAKKKFFLIKGFCKNIDSSVNAGDTETIEKENVLIVEDGKFKTVKVLVNRDSSKHILSNAFLNALILELSIKILWELSHKDVFNYKNWKNAHDILDIYNNLLPDIQKFISSKYQAELKYFQASLEEWLNSYKSQDLSKKDREHLESAQYYSIEDFLRVNRTIVCNGKYEFQIVDKINVITGCVFIPEDNETFMSTDRQPSPFLMEIIDFIEKKIADLSPKKKSS